MNIFVIGSDSFIARHFIKEYHNKFQISSVSMVSTNINNEIVLEDFFNISNACFQNIDVVINFAAIVHKTKIRDDGIYDLINYKLAIFNAKKAKQATVKLFIQISTIAVYGNQSKINIHTIPSPNSSYGFSKLKADNELINMQDELFKISIIRIPMVYGGVNTPGNMIQLIHLANGRFPLPFKTDTNSRDFINVRNLIQFIAYIINNELFGILLLSDQEPVSTKYLITTISEIYNRKAFLIKPPNLLLNFLRLLTPAKYNKLFGSLEIETNLSIDVISNRYSVKEGLYEMIRSSFLNTMPH